ncbi:MAG TPA: LysM peptidoglycan-binding domain-containing protein [Lacunisphaera sp.]|nr:LysM peptidoglycan-binding domain-containing protein [Lacunisphaera sp.]
MLRVSTKIRFILAVGLGLAALFLAACSENERSSYANETDEPAYREGTALLKAGRKQEALNAFLKVIAKRGDEAPESHLEAGLLYLQHINDPLSAIYHFKKYLMLRPNSAQAPLVRQRIDAATREFARTLPAQPLENQLQRVDLVATLDRLKQENEALKRELADLKASRGVAPGANGNDSAEKPAAGPGTMFSITTDSIPVVHTRTPAAAPSRPAATPPRATTSVRAPAATTPTVAPSTAPAGRRHIVQPGDTLSKIALRYYNNRAKWRDIYEANRDVMKNESDLKVGVALKIP